MPLAPGLDEVVEALDRFRGSGFGVIAETIERRKPPRVAGVPATAVEYRLDESFGMALKKGGVESSRAGQKFEAPTAGSVVVSERVGDAFGSSSIGHGAGFGAEFGGTLG
jgi:hypothetical protein